jgi:hypothetical protein
VIGAAGSPMTLLRRPGYREAPDLGEPKDRRC